LFLEVFATSEYALVRSVGARFHINVRCDNGGPDSDADWFVFEFSTRSHGADARQL
jgi:hypothetical protein